MNDSRPYSQPYYPPQQRRRPLGVTILAILEALGGIVLLIAALGSLLVAVLANDPLVHDTLKNSTLPQFVMDNLGLYFGLIAVLSFVLAMMAFLLAYGFLHGRGWAWKLGVAMGIVFIVWSFVNPAIYGFSIDQLPSLVIGVGIQVVIIFYLFQPGAKAWFTG